MSALSEFHFIYPYWFMAIPVVLLLVWWLAKSSAGSQAWQHFIDERLADSYKEMVVGCVMVCCLLHSSPPLP